MYLTLTVQWKQEGSGGEGGVAGRSTAPRGGSPHGGGRVMVRGGPGGDKAKVYESKGTPNYSYTIHMTSSRYNNTAVLYCTVHVRLNIWLDKADPRLQYPETSSVLH